jgi:predicted AlkP superfamily phosphohydrolase/phosphomutase/tetratricopeptide (TPR) repeat protein
VRRRVAALSAVLLAAAGAAAFYALRGASGADAVDPAVPVAVAKTRKAHPELFRRKVVLLGFDSCDPDLVEKYVLEGKLPHFAQLRREGAHGPLRSTYPILSPVVWTTIATGMKPERHGILDFVTNTPAGMVPVSSRMRQADTIWELLSRQGEKVGVVGWLVTWPAERVNGFLVTERMGALAYDYLFGHGDIDSQRTWPDALVADLADDVVQPDDVTYAKIRPFLDIEEKEYRNSYSKSFDPFNRVGNLRLVLATAETFRNIGERLHAEEKPRFFACYFEAMDAISHQFMPFAPPKQPQVPTDLYLKYRDAIEANYVWHDRVLGEFMDQCDPETTLLVVSDHGFKSGDFRMADSSDFHAKTGAMWHRQFGAFYAWGDGVKRGAKVSGATVYDVAPTVLAAMGYPVPDDMPGNPLVEAFEGGLPVESVPTYYAEARRDAVARIETGEAVLGPEEEEQLAKFRTMGYIGGDRSDPVSTSLNLGSSYLASGMYEKAYQEFKKVLATSREPRVLDSVAETCLLTRRHDEAEACLAESLQKDPGGVAALLLRAKVLVVRRKFVEAEASARAALRIKNDQPQIHETLALVFEFRMEDARSRDDSEAATRFARSAIAAHEDALRLEPRFVQALFGVARIRLEIALAGEDVVRACDELGRLLEMDPGHILARNNRAIASLRLALGAKGAGRAEEAQRLMKGALEDCEKAIAADAARKEAFPGYRGYAKGWANKAYVLRHMGRESDALAAAKKVREIEPSYVFRAEFVDGMKKAGHVVPPPSESQVREKRPR